MSNPLSINQNETEDIQLINDALNGNKKALNQLIVRHEKFVYNLAWKFTADPNEAAA